MDREAAELFNTAEHVPLVKPTWSATICKVTGRTYLRLLLFLFEPFIEHLLQAPGGANARERNFLARFYSCSRRRSDTNKIAHVQKGPRIPVFQGAMA